MLLKELLEVPFAGKVSIFPEEYCGDEDYEELKCEYSADGVWHPYDKKTFSPELPSDWLEREVTELWPVIVDSTEILTNGKPQPMLIIGIKAKESDKDLLK